MALAVAWTGALIGLVAKWKMAKSRFTAIQLLFVATLIAGAWAIYLHDWPSVASHFLTCALMVRTLLAWRKEGGSNDS